MNDSERTPLPYAGPPPLTECIARLERTRGLSQFGLQWINDFNQVLAAARAQAELCGQGQTLPLWGDVAEKPNRTPLEQFIFDNEPAGVGDETVFRKRLAAMVGLTA